MTTSPTFSELPDHALIETAKQLAADERHATTAIVRALIEIDRRKLYLAEGCASLFTWCVNVLRLSEGAAYNRIEAARAAQLFPMVLELFDQSAITLTTIRLLRPHLTRTNHVAVLDAARHKSRREIEILVASLAPKPDVPTIVRRIQPGLAVASPKSMAPQFALLDVATTPTQSAMQDGEQFREAPAPGPATGVTAGAAGAAGTIAPISPERYRLQVTISRATHDKLKRAQALLRHAVPTGDMDEVLKRALTLLVAALERQRFAAVVTPRSSRAGDRLSRYIPAAVRRAVWRRDEGRCGFIGPAGRCGETAWLEFHHLEPFAAGGVTSVDNLALRCRAHNQHEMELAFPRETNHAAG